MPRDEVLAESTQSTGFTLWLNAMKVMSVLWRSSYLIWK